MPRLGLLVALLVTTAASAQVPSPGAFLGYELGERFTPHHRVVDYVTAVAEASDRVTLVPYGTTPQGRPLLTLVVASPETDLEAVQTSVQAAARGEGEPSHAVVWLSYNVHGNESVGTEAAMATLHDLATSARAAGWLEEAVVILDPCLNPDGRDRYVHGYQNRRSMAPDADPDAWEHDEPWPGGRVNHYLFDLNRDWAWATQPETRQRLPLYNTWLPAVHVDFHEQSVDSPYYFAPGAEPFHAAITPWQRELQTRIGQANAELFDRTGRLYFTAEVFDLLYPGYGDTWPTFNGSVGMTYEQGGSGRAGLAIVTAEDDTLTLADRIRGHVDTGLETIATTVRNAPEVRRRFAAYFQQEPRDGIAAYAVWGSWASLWDLAELLRLQGIEYEHSTRDQRLQGVQYGGGLQKPTEAGVVNVPEHALVVSLDQPKRALAQVLFEPDAALADSLTYDATAWALPYVYNLKAAALDTVPESARVLIHNTEVSTIDPPAGWIGQWEGPADARVLGALLREGIGVRVLPSAATVGGVEYGRGAYVVTRAGNEAFGDELGKRLREISVEFGRPLTPFASGLIADGPDLGSNRVGFVRQPRVAVLADSPVSSTALGEVWSLFDQRWNYPLTLLRAASFSSRDLDGTDVLILPSGSYGAWLTDGRVETIRDWVREGGRLVAMEGAATALARLDGFALAMGGAEEEAEAPADDDLLRRYEDRARENASRQVPGSIYRVELDDSHPLAYGYSESMYVLKRRVQPVPFLSDDWNVGVIRDGAPVAGFAGIEAQAALENTVVFAVEDAGRGHVIYLLDSPIFRGFWAGGELLMANAVFGMGAQ
ncbi:MAG: M14 family zinc carboxypeptidase [Bacteroidota bacterium]